MPLVQAVFEGNAVQLSELIGQREDVNAIVRTEHVNTPFQAKDFGKFLVWVVQNDHLLPYLSPPQDSEKRTALHAAAYRGETECISILIQAGY